MRFLRMCWIAFRLAWPHVLMPWRSPLVRWRMETYGIADAQGRLLHAEALSASQCLRFVLRHPRALGRFLRWAASL
jgi:hypothetical protein